MSPRRVPLAQIATIVQGGRHKLSGNNFVDPGDGYPAFGAGGLNGYLPTYEFDGQTAVVLSSIGARCGKCFLVSGKWSSLANTQVILPDPTKADARFLWYQLNDESSWLRAGTAQPFIKPSTVKTRAVELPSLPEQRRVADILDKADAIRRKRKEAIALTEELLRSAFLEMFGDPVTNPKGWLVRPLGELTQLIDYGVTASASPNPVGPKFLRITDIQDNRVDWESVPYCECDATTAGRAKLLPGDIVFARTGATTGKSFWIRNCPENAVFASYLIRVRPGQRLVSGYLSEFFQSAGYWSQIRSMAEGAAQPGVNASKLGQLKVPVPPVERQRDLEGVLDKIAKVQVSCENALRSAGNLFDSLVDSAFRVDQTGKAHRGLFDAGAP